jgi:hypothetical protein
MIQSAALSIARGSCVLNNFQKLSNMRAEDAERVLCNLNRGLHAENQHYCYNSLLLSERAFIIMQCTEGPS